MAKAKRTDQWCTVSEAAEKLGLSPRRILQFVTGGRLPAWKVNSRMYLIADEELQKFSEIERASGAAGHQKK